MDSEPSSRVKPRSLKLGFFNACGVREQRDEIATFLRDHNLDIFLVQESFLKPSHRDPKIANYKLVRNDRPLRGGGGTLIYYKRSLYCMPIDPPPLSHFEVSVCRIGMTGHQSITLVSAYIPPNASASERIRPDLETLLGLSSSVIIAGDLNAKHISWNSHSNNPRGRSLELLSSHLNFDVIAPMNPTHFPRNPDHRPDVLDIALLKNVNLGLRSLEAIQELDSDHRPVVLHLCPRIGPPNPGQRPH